MNTPSPVTVAITGSTGFVGRTLVRELLHRGHSVRALVRSREKASAVLPDAPGRLTLVSGDATNAGDVQHLLHGAQACINLIGIIREVRRLGVTFHRMHVEVTRILVKESENLGVQRFLQMSAIGVRPVGVAEYQHTKFEAEQAVRRSNLQWTILRPGLIHGRDSSFIAMAKQWCTGHAQPFFFLPYFTGGNEDQRVPLGGTNPRDPRVAPIAVQDVAEAFANALSTKTAIGEVYNLCGPEVMSWPQMLTTIREGIPGALPALRPFGIPGEFAALQAQAASFINLGQFLPFDAGMARMGMEDSVADMTKAREELNLRPRAFQASFAEYAAALK
jgi:uncharacterized protein YbjT (DUF2867 family)